MVSLINDIWRVVMSGLHYETVVRMSRVCSKWRQLASELPKEYWEKELLRWRRLESARWIEQERAWLRERPAKERVLFIIRMLHSKDTGFYNNYARLVVSSKGKGEEIRGLLVAKLSVPVKTLKRGDKLFVYLKDAVLSEKSIGSWYRASGIGAHVLRLGGVTEYYRRTEDEEVVTWEFTL
jgi:hypothetical protein